MGDSWEDDWEAEADGFNVVDESKFAGEDEEVQDSWEDAVPATQPKKPTVNKYAAKDREAAEASLAQLNVDSNDPAAVAAAQANLEAKMLAEQLGVSQPASDPVMDMCIAAKTNADFTKLAGEIMKRYGEVHVAGPKFKFFVKALARSFCEALDSKAVKEVVTVVDEVRSKKDELERQAIKLEKAKKGKKTQQVRVDNELDDFKYDGHGDADDDVDFM